MWTHAIVAAFLYSLPPCMAAPAEDVGTAEELSAAGDALVSDGQANDRSALGDLCLLMGLTQPSREDFCRVACPEERKGACWSAASQGGQAWASICVAL